MNNHQHTYQNRIRPLDPKRGIELLSTGTFERFVTVGGRPRRLLIYIPEGARPSCAGIFVLGENGQTADQLLKDSLWRQLADNDACREKFTVFFLEPADGIWHTDEPYGDPDGDVAYVNAAYLEGTKRDLLCVHEAKFYLFGCREGGVIANMAAMQHPVVWAGVGTAGGTDISEDYMTAAAADICTDLDGFEDENHMILLRKGTVAVPAMILGEPGREAGADRLASYWKKAAGITGDGQAVARGIREYVRETEPPFPRNQEKEAFRVQVRIREHAGDGCANEDLEEIRSFLFAQRRWMGDPGGDLRVTRDPVRDIGMKYYTEEIDGWLREWYVYLPDSADTEKKEGLPLVFAMHGYSCSGEIYAGNSEWHKVAERYGFILVHPSGTPGMIKLETQATSAANTPLPVWNVMCESTGPDENRFFRHMLSRISDEYPVDRSRVYITGHSYGSMMTQFLAITDTSLFAAAAPCSGVFFDSESMNIRSLPAIANRPDGPGIPVWMFVGEYEPWLFPHIPAGNNITGETIRYWQHTNHLQETLPDPQGPEWIRRGIWNDLTFTNDSGIPMVRYTWVGNMPHATTEEMSFRIWEEFFSKFSRRDGMISGIPQETMETAEETR